MIFSTFLTFPKSGVFPGFSHFPVLPFLREPLGLDRGFVNDERGFSPVYSVILAGNECFLPERGYFWF